MVLHQYRVLDLTDEKGIFCSRLLADLGEEVIRIQKPSQNQRRDDGDLNPGRHYLSLDIENLAGQELFKKIAATADVLVESNPPGYLDSLGLGWKALKSLNPGLIFTSITPYGQSGPYRDFTTSELVSSAMGGQVNLCGQPNQPPLKPFGGLAYSTAGLFAVNGIFLALRQRHTSNRGQFIDISIHECVAGTLDHALVRYFWEGQVAGRTGNLSWNGAFGTLPCQDGHILLSFDYQWETLIELLGAEGLAADLTDPRWLDQAERQRNRTHILAVLEKWTLKHTASELVELGQLMRFPWARLDSISEVLANPQLNARGFFREVHRPDSGETWKLPGLPFRLKDDT